MIFHGSSPTGPRDNVKSENCNFPPYATSTAHNSGSGSRDSRIAGNQSRGLDYFAASSIPNSASSGASYVIMPPKRQSSGEPNNATAKHVKVEQPEEFSNAVKKRLASSTRTGQACDRCKVRKIRCDGLPGGCSPCLQNNTECRTTDRITGRATQRGYVEGLEQQNRDIQHRIRELEQRLIQSGADIKPSDRYHSTASSSYDYNQPSSAQASSWSPAGPSYPPQSSNTLTAQQQETNMFRTLPVFRTGCTGDNYLGVSPGNSNLSSIKGTALSILGMEIDIADFESSDMDEPDASSFHLQLYNKSYQAFLQSALNINPRLDKVELPAREEGITYAEWYFRVINPYMPLLHKPTFMRMLTRWYDDPTFRPTVAETVMAHMVFAIMFFQYAARNWEDAANQTTLNNQSNMHYHYSLSMFYQLSCSHTIQDVQALTLLCAHLRNFPKPGASWMLTQTTMSLAVELGMHRSASRWPLDALPNALDIEMRKRTFWSLLTIHVTLSGKLGRPMAFRMEDFDVEIPEPVDDDLLSENGLDTSRPGNCVFKVGLQAFRIVPLFLEMYNTIYAVRRQPENYVAMVNSLETKLRAWKEGIPAELLKSGSGPNDQESRLFALYVQSWQLEFRLLLRHPSVSMTSDPTFIAESMRICVECSRQMLGVVRQIQKFKSLDTTWYNTAVYVMAITTTLFAQWDKRGETSAADLAALREEMDIWLEIMGDVGALLGSGPRLREAVRVVTDGTLGLLSGSLPAKNTSYIPNIKVEENKSPPVQQSVSNNNYNTAQNYNYENATTNGTGTSTSGYLPPDSQMAHQSTPYPAATQYSTYNDGPSSSAALTYSPQDTHSYASYPAVSIDSAEASLLAAFPAQASQASANNWQQRHAANPHSGSQAWHQWTSTMAGNLEPQDCYSASALMQLGGRELGDGSNANVNGNTNRGLGQTSAPLAEMNAGQTVGMDHSVAHLGGQVSGSGGMGATWPLNIFDIGHAGPGA